MNSFADDLDYGVRNERRFAKLLVEKGYVIEHMAEGCFPDWDIMVQGGKTFEVKSDRKFLETGNIFIETKYKGYPSGLAETKATYFTVVMGNFAHTAKTDDVMRFVLSNPSICRATYGAGDEGNSVGFVIKGDSYKPKNMQVFELPL